MKKLDSLIKVISIFILIVITTLFMFALFIRYIDGEAYTGSFLACDFSEGWTVTMPDGTVLEDVKLPLEIEGVAGETYELTNTLPDSIRSGMRFSFRSVRENVKIYVNDKLRATYGTDSYEYGRRIVPSAYVLGELKDKDAGGVMTMYVTPQHSEKNIISEVTYAYGNNVWFPRICVNMPPIIIAVILIIFGLVTCVGYCFFNRRLETAGELLYLAETMLVAGLWMVSESEIRQIIFKSPYLSNIFAFALIEVFAIFGAMYVDEVQGKKYNAIYMTLEIMGLLVVTVNSALHFLHIKDYYETLIVSHAVTGFTIICIFGTIIVDIFTGRVKQYLATAIGIMMLLLFGLGEIISFYVFPQYVMGAYLGLGLVVLLAANLSQVVKRALDKAEERREYSNKMNQLTFRTIAGTIDAKDPYTGNHSERVGEYGRLICMKLAKQFKLAEEDFSRIRYIGKMHDIGKIGVPDSVLNKAGRLDEDEYAVMKTHTVTGADIVKNIENVPGLVEGVRSHHERWDGKGYPDGLAGEEIPVYARILCLADCFDAMTSDRVYRKKLSKARVIEEIKKNSGTQFDPLIAETVLAMIESGELPASNLD